MTRKQNSKLAYKPIHEIAEIFASRFIAAYGVADGERIAKLAWEMVVASRKSLERKYDGNN